MHFIIQTWFWCHGLLYWNKLEEFEEMEEKEDRTEKEGRKKTVKMVPVCFYFVVHIEMVESLATFSVFLVNLSYLVS